MTRPVYSGNIVLMVVRFTTLGKPTPKGGLNARVSKNGKVCLFYPANVKRAEKLVRSEAEKEMTRSGYPILGGRCIVHVRAYLKQTTTGKLIGDVDKIARLVLDAMTGVVYEDDSLVQAVTCSKHPLETNYSGDVVGLERTEVSVSLAG